MTATFGEKLKELRESASLTQMQLADKSGVPVGTIRDYEQMKRTPLFTTVIRLARGVGVSVEVFVPCTFTLDATAENRARGRPRKQARAAAAEPKKVRKRQKK